MKQLRNRLTRAAKWTATSIAIAVLTASPAFAADDPGTTQLKAILDNATKWLVGILATIATLFFTVGGIRYMMAGGDPGELEKAKGYFKSAAFGYALAALAPILVLIVKGILGVQ